jgi:Leucine-rich repeat (LRR) protein
MLAQIPYLTHINLSNNRIAVLPFFQPALKFVQELDLSHNQLTSLANFEQLTFLRHLCVDRNLLKNMSGLSECINLESLSMRRNALTDVTGIENLKKLSLLDLVG